MQFKLNELDVKKFEKLLDQKEKNIFNNVTHKIE